jgi:hypothetical protein
MLLITIGIGAVPNDRDRGQAITTLRAAPVIVTSPQPSSGFPSAYRRLAAIGIAGSVLTRLVARAT